eukprot:TRINITY_DN658_c3_g1_i1.p1 TRINITY_DN658_c3_g1~~TRINITY_DN658_c3_g1_i1.p1  ORF type:complete len:1091 (+),score=345.96 TRINITY_DN658_c3_g1_i1:110-3274(+)
MYNPAHQSRLGGRRTSTEESTGESTGMTTEESTGDTKRPRGFEHPSQDSNVVDGEEEEEEEKEKERARDDEKEELSLRRPKRSKRSEVNETETKFKKGSIQEIDSSSVHNITSGQVILEPASIVKELVENSLDAGATNIELLVKDYGMSLIQVSDNGHGIPKDDFQAITMKHFTSKLKSFDDLDDVQTLGFRGEALSSVCATGKVTISSCHRQKGDESSSSGGAPEKDVLGWCAKYDRLGRLSSLVSMSRPVGTSVSVEDLFSTMPVRRKTLEKTCKRDFQKLVQVVQQYAVMWTAVRFVMTHQGKNILTSPGRAGDCIQSICSVFASPILKHRLDKIDMEVDIPLVNVAAESIGSENSEIQTGKICVHGYVSSPIPRKRDEEKLGSRASLKVRPRQFLYLWKRPIEWNKLTRVINEVFRSFHSQHLRAHLAPFVVLNFEFPAGLYDVNVSPDKRKVFFTNEKRFLDMFQKKLLDQWVDLHATVPVEKPVFGVTPLRSSSQQMRRSQSSHESSQDEEAMGEFESIVDFSDTPEDREDSDDAVVEMIPTPSEKRKCSFADDKCDIAPDESAMPSPASSIKSAQKQADIDLCSNDDKESITVCESVHNDGGTEENTIEDFEEPKPTETLESTTVKNIFFQGIGIDMTMRSSDHKDPETPSKTKTKTKMKTTTTATTKLGTAMKGESLMMEKFLHSSIKTSSFAVAPQESTGCRSETCHHHYNPIHHPPCETESTPDSILSETQRSTNEVIVLVDDKDSDVEDPREGDKPVFVEVDLRTLCNVWSKVSDDEDCAQHENVEIETSEERGTKDDTKGFVDEEADDIDVVDDDDGDDGDDIDDIDGDEDEEEEEIRFEKTLENSTGECEEELSRVLQRSYFHRMRVVGQFNKGFIVVTLPHRGGESLFIIDQHAADEIYNFERLRKNPKSRPKSQRLIAPIALDPEFDASEIVVSRCRSWGFEVRHSEEECKWFMTSVPVGRLATFGVDDLYELVQGEGLIEPSKMRAEFASRSCRMSIMQGDPLNIQEMERIVRHLGDLDRPWNCPHGRPTIRHLMDIN